MIETELKLSPTTSVEANPSQLCILNIDSTFPEKIYQKSEKEPTATFDLSDRTINVQIEILDGDKANLKHVALLKKFPTAKETYTVVIEYFNKEKDKTSKQQSKTVQMEVNMEPKPANQLQIQ